MVSLDQRLLWRWRQGVVMATATRRYVRSTDEVKRAHKDIASLLLDVWLSNKPFVVPDKRINIVNNGYRYLAPHPLMLSSSAFNVRLLNELSMQILKSGQDFITPIIRLSSFTV
jgi:hypothetical protein